jgi:hypothetical protein
MRLPGKGDRIWPVSSRPAEVVPEAEVAGKWKKASSASGSRGDVTPGVVGSAGLAVVSGCVEFLTRRIVLGRSPLRPYCYPHFVIGVKQ